MSANDRWGREDMYTFQAPNQYPQTSAPYATTAERVEASQDRDDGRVALQSSRRAHLRVSRVSPWSVTKFAFVVSLVCFIVLFVAVAILYAVLAVMGVFDAVGSLMTALTGSDGGLFAAPRVLGYAAFVGGINVVLITLLLTLGAYVYNIVADLVGGIEVTLTERD